MPNSTRVFLSEGYQTKPATTPTDSTRGYQSAASSSAKPAAAPKPPSGAVTAVAKPKA